MSVAPEEKTVRIELHATLSDDALMDESSHQSQRWWSQSSRQCCARDEVLPGENNSYRSPTRHDIILEAA